MVKRNLHAVDIISDDLERLKKLLEKVHTTVYWRSLVEIRRYKGFIFQRWREASLIVTGSMLIVDYSRDHEEHRVSPEDGEDASVSTSPYASSMSMSHHHHQHQHQHQHQHRHRPHHSRSSQPHRHRGRGSDVDDEDDVSEDLVGAAVAGEATRDAREDVDHSIASPRVSLDSSTSSLYSFDTSRSDVSIGRHVHIPLLSVGQMASKQGRPRWNV